MRRRSYELVLLVVGLAFASTVEWVAYDPGLGLASTVADFTVGCVLIVCGLAAWDRRPESRTGLLMLLAGATWFLGNVSGALIYLHRGPLVQLLLSYPTGRLRSRAARTVVAAAYVDGLVEPLARNDTLTLALASAVVLAAIHGFATSSGPAHRAAAWSLAAVLLVAGVLVLGAAERLLGVEGETTVLWAYDAAIAAASVALLVDLLRGRWGEGVVAGLVVDLGAPGEAGTLRTKLARALGDPSLVIGYRLVGSDDFVDDAGRPVEFPPAGSGLAVTPLLERDEEVAVLVHDAALLEDGRLLESVAAAARIAVANAALQVEERAQAVELERSRRRIVEAADEQRRRIQEKLDHGAGRRLEIVAALLVDARKELGTGDEGVVATLEDDLAGARLELEEFARGVHPPALTDGGLMPALAQLADRSVVPVDVRGEVGRLPSPVEAALYFVCSEALANVGKHAAASQVTVQVRADRRHASVVVSDDGVGGADSSTGSGLRGLADRVEALGGQLRIASARGAGTVVTADISF